MDRRTGMGGFRGMRQEGGGTLVLMAVALPLVIITMALVVDIGRIYAVQGKAQNASDSALLGAVATLSTNDVVQETERLFKANYPENYMGSVVGDIAVAEISPGVFEATYTVTVPTTITGIFSENLATLKMLSQVTRGLDTVPNQRLELALVLDNTGSMDGSKIAALKAASTDLTNILFGEAETLNNLHISIVPYDVSVNIGPERASWIQGAYLPAYNIMAANGKGFVSNRNSDSPPNEFNDFTDDAPQSEATRFRVPINAPNASCGDIPINTLPFMKFGMNVKSEVLGVINTMTAAGCTRINVGLMWGWFTLSPEWRGLWDPGLPDLPAQPDALLSKVAVLMTDGQNTVFLGINGTSYDDDSTRLVCESMKAKGITIYTVGFGQGVNQNLLRDCATTHSHYWFAPSEAELRTAFSQIADDILFNTLRLSK